MFWGLIMEPGRCYTQTVKVSFHVSMAALDISNSSDDPAQVMCVFEGRNYLLCTLNKKDKLQCPLDLNFEVGTKVSFATNGKSHVHLTGYLTSLDDELDEEEEEEAEVEEEVTNKKDKKRLKALVEGPPKKKPKTIENNTATTVEEEESSDSDFDIDKLIKEETFEDNTSDSSDEEEKGNDSEEEEEEEASSLSEEESEEEEEQEVKPKQNGISKASSTPVTKKKKGQQQEKIPKEKPKKEQAKPKKMTLKNGVIAQDLKEGHGEVIKPGKFVQVYYEGRLKDNNKMFDSTTKGPGFGFRVGKGEVIKGWDIGLVGMKLGGKRRLICPPGAAYGPKGSPPVIPPNATLVFDVEVKKVS